MRLMPLQGGIYMYGLTPFERNSYNLFNAFHDFEKDFFDNHFPAESCKTDIKEEDGRYVVEAELPGFEKDDINIDINGNTLTISAENSVTNEEKSDGGKYIRRERSYGAYSRSFDISNIDSEHIDAEYKNGVLILNLPKKQEAVPSARRLEIK